MGSSFGFQAVEGFRVLKLFRCPTDGRFLRKGMDYTLRLRHTSTNLTYAHCSACKVLFAFVGGRRPRVVAWFAVNNGVIAGQGVRLGSAKEFAAAEQGIRTVAHKGAQHPKSLRKGKPRCRADVRH